MQNNLALSIKPEWEEIENVRNTGRKFLKSHKLSDEIMDALTMVISELVENAIKYGSFPAGGKIDISIAIQKSLVIIEVKNPIDDTGIPFLRHLDETIQWIRGYQDPFESYIIKLRQISSKSLQDLECGLGLVRISYEGRSILDFYVSEDNMLNVSAVYNF